MYPVNSCPSNFSSLNTITTNLQCPLFPSVLTTCSPVFSTLGLLNFCSDQLVHTFDNRNNYNDFINENDCKYGYIDRTTTTSSVDNFKSHCMDYKCTYLSSDYEMLKPIAKVIEIVGGTMIGAFEMISRTRVNQ